MTEERRQILEMLAEGKITAQDAERLLDKLNALPETDRATESTTETGRRPRAKVLCVKVDGAEGEKVNVRVPLALVRTGVKIAAILPDRVTHKLSAQGIDLGKLSELDADELTAALSELEVDVDSDTGEVVRVCCE